jgi:hypothetical protein
MTASMKSIKNPVKVQFQYPGQVVITEFQHKKPIQVLA